MTVGKSTFGKRSTPSRVNENTPMTVSERIRTVAKTGRLTQSSASHCMKHLHGDPERVALHLLGNLRSVGELRDVLRRDALTSFQALGNFHEIADPFAGRHDPLVHVIAADDV